MSASPCKQRRTREPIRLVGTKRLGFRFPLQKSNTSVFMWQIHNRQGADAVKPSYRITVENRDYHQLSQNEIGGAKRISQQLSGNEQKSLFFQQPRRQSKIILKVVQFAYGQPLSYFPLRDRTNLSPEAETNTTRGSIQL
jgi:hypothetical protein